jgi:tRNA 5-methylaminomethyl-2-thiouridine biosynthesis bifunctional protein
MTQPASIQLSDGTPFCDEFNDYYFSKLNAVEEARYAFLENNQLPSRWHHLKNHHFSICETGFGTGLNFLCTWDLWLKNSQPHEQLHFISVEKSPITKSDLTKIMTQWPEFSQLSEQLLIQYPPLVAGWHTIHFQPNPQRGTITLQLFFGDIESWLPQIQGPIDAWFLDGFSPSNNPEMWHDTLFLTMAKLTKAQGTATTFATDNQVKRGLKAAGFNIEDTKKTDEKRDISKAVQTLSNGPQAPFYIDNQPWFGNPTIDNSELKENTALVIGGGISGCSTAWALAKRGWKVKILEKHATLASQASGNSQGVLYAKLATNLNPHSQFYLAGYLYSLNLLNAQLDREHWDDCGVLQLALNDKELSRQQSFIKNNDLSDVIIDVNRQQASELAGINIEHPGLFFKKGSWVYPKYWCEALIQHENIEVVYNTHITTLTQESNQHWQATSPQGHVFNAKVVVVCNALQSLEFNMLDFLPLKGIPGQISTVEAKKLTLNTILCGTNYVTPTLNGELNFGASFRVYNDDTSVLQSDHIKNIENLTKSFPSVAQQLSGKEPIKGRTSVRCTTQDYTPIAGPVCNAALFNEEFSALKKSKKWRFYNAAPFLTGLYVNLGHGSRGLTSAPICAELVAAQINNEPWPMPKKLAQILSPNRFLVKGLIS